MSRTRDYNAKEAVAYLKKLHSIVRYLDISDAIMAQGSMRCDVNVSIREQGEKKLGTRTEIKNINSFRFVEKAINSEIQRQQEIIEDGGSIVQETEDMTRRRILLPVCEVKKCQRLPLLP